MEKGLRLAEPYDAQVHNSLRNLRQRGLQDGMAATANRFGNETQYPNHSPTIYKGLHVLTNYLIISHSVLIHFSSSALPSSVQSGPVAISARFSFCAEDIALPTTPLR